MLFWLMRGRIVLRMEKGRVFCDEGEEGCLCVKRLNQGRKRGVKEHWVFRVFFLMRA